MKSVAVVSFCRSDYSSLRPVLQELTRAVDVQTFLLIGGAHLETSHGRTECEIQEDGFTIHERIYFLGSDDSPGAIARALGVGVQKLSEALDRIRPDIVLFVGDRIELLALGSAATALGIPLAHISGGDVTEGSLDNQVRHAMSKLSHLHFVSMAAHRERLLRMGEEEWRITITGDPALDALRDMSELSRGDLEMFLGISLCDPLLVVTYHPDSIGGDSRSEIAEVLAALEGIDATIIFTDPNPDAGRSSIVEAIDRFAGLTPRSVRVASLGAHRYYNLLRLAACLVGNSSSGIWEAPSFALPAVNIGRRQAGRRRGANVIDCEVRRQDIRKGILKALSPDFRRGLAGISNPYGDGRSASRIVERLRRLEARDILLLKREVAVGDHTPVDQGKD